MTAVDKAKLWLAVILAIGGIYYGFHGNPATELTVRAGALIGGIVFAGLLVYFSQPGRDFAEYCRASSIEVRKVVWPRKNETIRMTGIVLVFILVCSLFLWLVDSVLAGLLGFLAL